MSCATKQIWRWEPATEPGLNYEWWLDTAGPHVDPLEWDGPADPVHGFPAPTAVAPDSTGINNSASVNDSNSGAGAARYGRIWGWVYIPEGVTHWQDANANTGELGMVLAGTCCGGSLVEQPGANHETNTGGTDRTLMDPSPVPISGGWAFILSPISDQSAFGGLQIQFAPSATGPWTNSTTRRPTAPAIESMRIPECQELTEAQTAAGWVVGQCPPPCCQPTYTPAGGITADEVQALIDAQDHDDPQPSTITPIPDNEQDDAIRTGQIGTSLEYARADHNHAIVRQSNPGDPVITAGGSAAISQSLILDRWSTEETYEYAFRVRVAQPAGTSWGWISVPNIGGFQRPQIVGIGTYRSDSNAPQTDDGTGASLDGASPRGPLMAQEVHHWSSTQRLYLAYFRRDEAITSMFIEFTARYIRA